MNKPVEHPVWTSAWDFPNVSGNLVTALIAPGLGKLIQEYASQCAETAWDVALATFPDREPPKDAVELGAEIKSYIEEEFGILGGTLHAKINTLVNMVQASEGTKDATR